MPGGGQTMGLPMRTHVWAICVWAILLVGPTEAVKADSKTLSIGYPEMWPLIYSDDGVSRGYVIDLITAAMTRMNKPFTISEYPIKRMYQLMASGKLDICVKIHADGQALETTIPGVIPIAGIRLNLYARGPDPVESVWHLFNTEIISITGYQYRGLRNQLAASQRRIRFLDVPNPKNAFAMLQMGRSSYLLGYEQAARRIIPTLDIPDLTTIPVGDFPLHLFVSSELEGGEGILRQIEDAIEQEWLNGFPPAPNTVADGRQLFSKGRRWPHP